MITTRTMRALVVAMFVTGAVAGGAVLSQPAAAADSRDAPAGVWDGMIRGKDLANAGGPNTAPAHLVITEDGRWTMSAMGQTESGTVRREGKRVVLDGTVTGGDPMAIGRAVSYTFSLRGEDLYGSGDVFVLGHRAGVALSFDKQNETAAAASRRSGSAR